MLLTQTIKIWRVNVNALLHLPVGSSVRIIRSNNLHLNKSRSYQKGCDKCYYHSFLRWAGVYILAIPPHPPMKDDTQKKQESTQKQGRISTRGEQFFLLARIYPWRWQYKEVPFIYISHILLICNSKKKIKITYLNFNLSNWLVQQIWNNA